MSFLSDQDPEVAQAIEHENQRQRDSIVLIASENYASKAVLEAQSGVMNNKYAEGYPGRRYYGGCENVDVVERLAISRVQELFGAQHANVQPHSGAQANMAVYFALLEPGDTVMGMQLDQGGHLTHGASVNFSGNLYKFVPYGVQKDTETIDYDQVETLAREHRPKLIVAGCSAYARVIDFPRFPGHCRRGWRQADGGYGPYCRTDRRGRPPFALSPCAGGHLHHPKNAARAPRWSDTL